MKYLVWTSVILLIIAVTVLAIGYEMYEKAINMPEPQPIIKEVVREVEIVKLVPSLRVEQVVVEKDRVIAIGDLEPFKNEGEFKRFILDNRISNMEGWTCVDYALRMQIEALRAGKLMSLETIIYDEQSGHMGVSAVIGDEVWFGEPVNGTIRLLGKAGDISIIYEKDWTKNKISDLSWR